MLLRIRSIIHLAERINGYELVDPDGRNLEHFDAGAHISVRLGEALVRDFSLWNDPAERARYCIAVLRSEEHTSELQSHLNLVCRLLLEKKHKHTRTTFH